MKKIIYVVALFCCIQAVASESDYRTMLNKESEYPIDNVSNEVIWEERDALDKISNYIKDNELVPDFWNNIRDLMYRYVKLGKGRNAEILREKCWKVRKEYRSRCDDIFDCSMEKCQLCNGRGWLDRDVGSLSSTITMPILCKDCVLGFVAHQNVLDIKDNDELKPKKY